MKPKMDTFRVGFTYKAGEVRHGALHTFDDDAGEETLAIPADTMQQPGSYKATLYIDDKSAQSVSFKVIVTPKITAAYMITEKAWEAFGSSSKGNPAKMTSFAAGVARVGVFISYTGMAKTDVNARWQAEMAPFFEKLDGQRPDEAMVSLEELMHLE